MTATELFEQNQLLDQLLVAENNRLQMFVDANTSLVNENTHLKKEVVSLLHEKDKAIRFLRNFDRLKCRAERLEVENKRLQAKLDRRINEETEDL